MAKVLLGQEVSNEQVCVPKRQWDLFLYASSQKRVKKQAGEIMQACNGIHEK